MKTTVTCPNGHTFIKSSDSGTCPQCESEKKLSQTFLLSLAAPARRALENAGINSVEKLSFWSEKEILQFHGIGKTSMPTLREVLEKAGLDFRKDL
jgi:DNA-directed RNA polymerase alpha subunit